MSDLRNYEITEEDVETAIMQEQYTTLGYKTTICLIILNTGAEVIGSYSPVNSEFFNIIIGKKEAKKEAIKKVTESLSSVSQWKLAIDAQEKARIDNEPKNKADNEKSK